MNGRNGVESCTADQLAEETPEQVIRHDKTMAFVQILSTVQHQLQIADIAGIKPCSVQLIYQS